MPIAVGRKPEGAEGARAAVVAAKPEAAGALESPPNPKPEVLIVEDDEDEVRFISRAIQRHGVANRFKIVRSGEAALDYLESTTRKDEHSPPAPKVVLLDLKLSGIDGLEVLRRIRAHQELCAIPVVILSSTSDTEEICECYRLGANSFVGKPARGEEPGGHVVVISRYWLDLNRPATAL
jgi:CheY-like chemotaxis protein